MKKEKLIVLEATLSYSASNKSEILRKAEYYSILRKEKQPIEFPNLGSVFKRPNNGYAGELIEKAGLKVESITILDENEFASSYAHGVMAIYGSNKKY